MFPHQGGSASSSGRSWFSTASFNSTKGYNSVPLALEDSFYEEPAQRLPVCTDETWVSFAISLSRIGCKEMKVIFDIFISGGFVSQFRVAGSQK